MKSWLCLFYANSDVAATLLRPRRWSYSFVALLYPFYIKSEIQLIYVQLNVKDRVLKSLCFNMNRRLIVLDDKLQVRRGQRAKSFWVRP